MREVRDRADIDEIERRIGGCLEKHGLGFRRDGFLPRGEIRAVDERARNAEARTKLLHDIPARAEERLRRDDMIAGTEVAQQRGGNGSHAGCRGACCFRAFEQADALFEHGGRRVREARVDETRLLVLEARLGLLGRRIDVALCEVERLGGLAERRARRAAVDEDGLGLPVGGNGRGCRLCHLRVSCRRDTRGAPKKTKTGLVVTRMCRARPGNRFRTALLASCFTWLQAGRPNHHDVWMLE